MLISKVFNKIILGARPGQRRSTVYVVQGGGVGGLGSAGRLQSPQRRWSQSAWAENATLAHAVPSFFVRRVSEFNPPSSAVKPSKTYRLSTKY